MRWVVLVDVADVVVLVVRVLDVVVLDVVVVVVDVDVHPPLYDAFEPSPQVSQS